MNFVEYFTNHLIQGEELDPRVKKGSFFQFTDDQFQAAAEKILPVEMAQRLKEYVFRGTRPDDFLTAVAMNDLADSVGMATELELSNMKAIVLLFDGWTPTGCHGSFEAVHDWMDCGGVDGTDRMIFEMAKRANSDFADNDVKGGTE